MKKITVADVLRECHGTLFWGSEDVVLECFSNDTRTIKKGDTYLGIYGENFDGNTFYKDAINKGAICCILDHFNPEDFDLVNCDCAIVLVTDTVLALQNLATYKRNLVDIPVIAVTGSVGKTSTKDMIASVLAQKYHVLKTPGNLNGQIGLPLSLLHLKDEEVMVLEMGMNDLGQISRLTKIARPSMAVITNIGTAHIGILGSRDNILQAKLEILEGMEKESTIVLNNDNDKLFNLDLPDYKICTCGINTNSEYQARDILVKQDESEFVVDYHGLSEQITIPVMGEAFVMNSLLAISVGDILGLSVEEIKNGLIHFHTAGNRMDIVSLKSGMTLINDSYNSNYEALKNALGVLVKYKGKRKIAVLGDVLEMNDFGKEIHEKIGLIPEVMELDALFLNGENAKYILDGAIMQGYNGDAFYFKTREELQSSLFDYLKEEDTILVKSSKGMLFSEIAENIKESYRL